MEISYIYITALKFYLSGHLILSIQSISFIQRKSKCSWLVNLFSAGRYRWYLYVSQNFWYSSWTFDTRIRHHLDVQLWAIFWNMCLFFRPISTITFRETSEGKWQQRYWTHSTEQTTRIMCVYKIPGILFTFTKILFSLLLISDSDISNIFVDFIRGF